jgi:hypothetical protein
MIISGKRIPLIFGNSLEGGELIVKKVLALILSVVLLVAFTFAVGCKKADEPKPVEAPKPPAEAPKAPDTPAPAPAPAPEKPAEAPKAPEKKK